MEVWQHFVKKLLPYFRSFKLFFPGFSRSVLSSLADKIETSGLICRVAGGEKSVQNVIQQSHMHVCCDLQLQR